MEAAASCGIDFANKLCGDARRSGDTGAFADTLPHPLVYCNLRLSRKFPPKSGCQRP
jgi:hypothetical protein